MVKLVRKKSARWNVIAPNGVAGFVPVRHMNRVCTYTTPKSEKAKEEVPAKSPVPSPEPAPEKPAEPTPPQEIEPSPVPVQPKVEKPAIPESPLEPAVKPEEAEKVQAIPPAPEPTEEATVPEVTAVVVADAVPTRGQLSDIPTLAYVSLGLGTAAFGLAGYFGAEMNSNADIANAMDYGSHSSAKKAQDQAIMANIALGVGAVGIAAGLYLVLDSMFWGEVSAAKKPELGKPDIDGVVVIPVDEGAVVQVGGSF